MNMKECNEYIDKLKIDYLTGNLKDHDLTELEDWISSSPENERYFSIQKEIWYSSFIEEINDKYDKDEAFKLFKKRVSKQNKMRNKWFVQGLKYAASILVLFLIGSLAYRQGQVNLKKDFAEIIVEAPLGTRTKLYLPDGTLVWLNAGTRLGYSQGFGVESREVNLEGEGYFEVVKKGRNPFCIKTKEMDLKVLGTKFNFRNYPTDQEVVVSLLEGKIELRNQFNPDVETILVPDERALLNKRTGAFRVETVKASNASEWTEGYLFFDEELLSDIIRKLERSYNVKFNWLIRH